MERIGGKRETRDRLKGLLKGGGHSTSTQVVREWNRIVLGACTKLLKILPTASDRMDVVQYMKSGYGREAARNWQITEWLMGPDTDFRLVEKRVADYARVRARAEFRVGISTVRDGTECAIAARSPYHRGDELRYEATCQKTHNICKQPTFLLKNIDRAKAAATALAGSGRKGDREMGKKALAALEKLPGNATKGRACHSANGIGGDICIALECADNETLLATDGSFETLCPALGLAHEKP
jgi:hypothetical protein